jgi:hypothetical protein
MLRREVPGHHFGGPPDRAHCRSAHSGRFRTRWRGERVR